MGDKTHVEMEEDMTDQMIRTILRAEGFSCPSCVAKIEKQVAKLPGVHAVEVKFSSARILIDHDQSVAATALIAAVKKAGYSAEVATF